MKAVGIAGARDCGLIDKPVPTPSNGYVLVKVHVAPMCNEHVAYSEQVYLERNRPDSLGHEFAGEVVASAPGASVSVGDRVVALCGFPCGGCEPCGLGYYAHCARVEDPREASGSPSGECGFGQYAIKRDWMLVPIPEGMSYEHASMASCGLGPTFGALRRLGARPGESVLITGLGPVGLGGVINAKARGLTAIGVARSTYRAKLGYELGADLVVDPGEDDHQEQIRRVTCGRAPDYAIESSGRPQYQRLLVDAVKRLGAVAFLAEPGSLELRIDEDLVQKGVTLLGTLDINLADAAELLRVIEQNPDRIDTYITHRLPMADVGQAFELQLARECGKVLLYPWVESSAPARTEPVSV